ncbi:unnamed protein product [Owenia fusiformis]|uniref:Uncharacterized protein n=1 Tax=Owenia fusiformis TaxID=6347 RepID=A0A8S4PTD3_OWEFU|nr:unnamed protein product [Owenia fusiformis]
MTYYKLNNFSCPVCPNGKKSNWVCAQDDKQMWIAETGYMKCDGGSHIDKICNWKWDCGNHGSHPFDRFQYADFEGFSYSLSQAVQLMGTAGAQWVGALCVELGKQYGRE